MFDVAPTELLLLGAVAIAVIPPKDLPRAMRFAGQWIGKARGMARHFRSGLDEMIRQSELDEIEKKWREENERIMREHPFDDVIDHTTEPAALPAPEAGVIEEPLPENASVETVPVNAENGTKRPPPIPEGNPPRIADRGRKRSSAAVSKSEDQSVRTSAPVEPLGEDGPELPLGLPPKS